MAININITNTVAAKEMRSINYLNRTYNEVKTEITKLMRFYFDGFWTDISEGNLGTAIIEINAHVADILNFYIDKQFNENFIDRAIEIKNIFSLAKGLGYYPAFTKPSVGELTMSFELPAIDSTTSSLFFSVRKNSEFISNSDPVVTFQNTETINFDDNVYNINDSTIRTTDGLKTKITRTGIKIVSGERKVFHVRINEANAFRKIILPEKNITEIISIVDSEGNDWTQVKSLAQEFVFTGVPNMDANSSNTTQYLLTIKRAPYRFVFEQLSSGLGQITFGSGQLNTNQEEFVIGPEDYIMQNKLTGKFTDFTPENIAVDDFLNTNALGIAPRNTTLTIDYRIGGGIQDNVSANTITLPKTLVVDFRNSQLSDAVKLQIKNSLVISNPSQTQGGVGLETKEQIRINASYNYAAQDRAVTLADYVARISSLPAQYGSIYRVYAKKAFDRTQELLQTLKKEVVALTDFRQSAFNAMLAPMTPEFNMFTEAKRNRILNLITSINEDNAANINLYVISRNRYGYLEMTTDICKRNIMTYLAKYRMMSDTININDVNIVNLGCRFDVQVNSNNHNATEILQDCLNAMQTYLHISNMEIGKPIIISDVVRMLQQITGVISVPDVKFYVLSGVNGNRVYSTSIPVRIEQLLDYNGVFIRCPGDSMFEVKYGTQDIIGRAVV